MSNAYTAFLQLLPSKPTNIAKVTEVLGEVHTVLLIGGGSLKVTSQKPYEVGDAVFIEGSSILAKAPDNPSEVLYV